MTKMALNRFLIMFFCLKSKNRHRKPLATKLAYISVITLLTCILLGRGSFDTTLNSFQETIELLDLL